MYSFLFRYYFILFSIILIIINVRSDEQHQNFFDPNLEHIREDVRDHYHIDLDNKTSEQELDWFYFQMHDFDHNLVLDGLEILTAMNHVIDENSLKSRETSSTQSPQTQTNDEENEDPMEYYKIRERYRTQIRWNEKFDSDSKTIDKLLEDYDSDNDGFISYTEYIIARRQSNHL